MIHLEISCLEMEAEMHANEGKAVLLNNFIYLINNKSTKLKSESQGQAQAQAIGKKDKLD